MKKSLKKQSDASNLRLQCLFEAVVLIRNATEAKQFLTDLCTPAELAAMADRWAVLPGLLLEQPYRAIHDETTVSVTTIGRVARNLEQGTGGYRLIYERQKEERKKKNVKKSNPNDIDTQI